jgi:hypothetical protein
MVIRSVAGVRGSVALESREPESAMDRMTERARADSDTPRERARVENHCFSCAERRTVTDGSDGRETRQIMRPARSAANADAQLSCHHSNLSSVQTAPPVRVVC